MSELYEISIRLTWFIGANYLIYKALQWWDKYEDYKMKSDILSFVSWELQVLIELRNKSLDEYIKYHDRKLLMLIKNIDAAIEVKQKTEKKILL